MSTHKILFLAIFILISFFSCKQNSTRADEKAVSFTNDIQPIITEYCTNRGCHHGGEQVSLMTYDDVIKNGYVVEGNPKDNVLYQAIDSKNPDERMPPEPHPALSAEQIKIVHEWIRQGAVK
ncbi:MAG: hypothetical protein KBF92_07085 [Bacteroidia bacterium]|nr:hypothetical protein [Bacteroidota bacterium]MBK8584433.1 hypothetical protein [Bacteroidota bacterium]MBP6335650.1 hypothetical protein [Bacteroidia bacterium]MBP9790094.1 hypothetical protein [Bacteroidia bacterium]MBP9923578.1 hypothetical protein [Bacteroidia bacterium]